MVIVGGVGHLADRFVAAALRGRGLDAHALPAPGLATLTRGRAVLPRGYSPTLYALVGALVTAVERYRAAGVRGTITFLTLGGHCAHQASDYVRGLEAAGLDEVDVIAPSPAMWLRGEPMSLPGRLRGRVVRSLIDAVVTGDVLTQLGCAMRPSGADPNAVDALIAGAARAIEEVFEQRRPVEPILRALGTHVRTLPRGRETVRPVRVRVMGEYAAACAPGELGAHLTRRLEQLGARVRPPLVTEWLLYVLWQLQPVLGARGPRLRLAICARLERRARAAGLRDVHADDPARLATLAGDAYPADLRGSTGHLEVGTFVLTQQRDLADAVVSVKCFASTTSGSVSDGVVHALARNARTGFLAVEITGEGDAQMESRLELLLDVARLRRRAHTALPIQCLTTAAHPGENR